MEIITTARVTRLAIITAAPGLIVQLGAAPPRAPVDQQTVSLGRIASMATTFAPTVTLSGGGSVTVSVGAIVSSAIAYSPTLSAGGAIVSVGAIASSALAFGPSISAGPVTVVVGAIASSSIAYGPTLAAPSPTINNIVIEGDSITSNAPDPNATPQPTDSAGGYAYRYRAHRPDKIIRVRAQGSRVAIRQGTNNGTPVYFDDVTTLPVPQYENDGVTPKNNAIGAHVTEDVSYGAQLVTYMIGTNDMAAMNDAPAMRSDLQLLYARYKAKNPTLLIAWSVPPALNSETQAAFYAEFMAKRAALLSTARDPSVWGQWADYYIPMGEQPDLVVGGNALFADVVHPNAAGQGKLYGPYEAFMDSRLDEARATSTMMYDAAWPVDQTGLAPSSTYTQRFVVSGLAHKGIALAGANALSVTGATLSLNGDAASGSKGGWLYNGDAIDLTITTPATNATDVPVQLQIGTETRTLTYRTIAAVTPAAYAHGGSAESTQPSATHTLTGVSFPADGTGLIAINTLGSFYDNRDLPTGISWNGVAATLVTATAGYISIAVYRLPVTVAAGAHDIVVTYQSARNRTFASYGTLTNADPVPTTASAASTNTDSAPAYISPAVSVPTSGIAIAFLGQYGGSGATPGTVTAPSTQFVSGFASIDNGEKVGLIGGKRTSNGTITFNFGGFGGWPIAIAVFKAAGS